MQNHILLQGFACNAGIFLGFSLNNLLDFLLFYYVVYIICTYLHLSKLAYFLSFSLLSSLEYLQFCTNFFNLVLLIEFILFSIIGFMFLEKLITISIIKAAIYFFLVNVIIALIFLYNCIIFLNTIILIQTPINLDCSIFLDMIGYYFLIQFNIYEIMQILIICLVVIGLVLLFKLTIMPLASQIIIVYSEISQILLLILITIYKLIFLIILLKLFIQNLFNLTLLNLCIVGLGIYTIQFGLIGYKQLNLKIILTYLTLIQISFILLGLIPGDILAYNYSLLYLAIYILQLLGVICLLMIIKCDNLDYFSRNLTQLKLINVQQFMYLFIIILSIQGLPPFQGFFAKFFLILIIFNLHYQIIVGFILLLIFSTSIIYFQILQNLFLGIKTYQSLLKYRSELMYNNFFNLNSFILLITLLNLFGFAVFPISITYYTIQYL